MVNHVVAQQPKLILDVACGPAAVSILLAQTSRAQIVGLDLSSDMLGQGVSNAAEAGFSSRINFILGQGERLPFADNTFDALTFTYLLRYVTDPRATIAELVRVVKPGGPIANLEFAVPSSVAWRVAWFGYTRWLLPIGGWLTGGKAWWDVGRFLGPSISQHYAKYSIQWTKDTWAQCGVSDVALRQMSLGGGLVMWGRKSA